jgi:hypothetical protein
MDITPFLESTPYRKPTPIEDGMAYKKLIEHGKTIHEIAILTKLSVATVRRRLALVEDSEFEKYWKANLLFRLLQSEYTNPTQIAKLKQMFFDAWNAGFEEGRIVGTENLNAGLMGEPQ